MTTLTLLKMLILINFLIIYFNKMFVNRARGAQRNRLKLSDSLRKGKKFQDAIQEIEKNS